MTKLTENERKALNNACARLRETNLGTKIGNIEDFLDIDILKTDANTVSKAIDELFDKWANPLLNITVPPPGFFTLAGDAEGNLWCYCNDETNPPVFEHDETTGDLYLNIASEDGANSYQVHVGNYIAVKHLNDYYKKTEIDSKLGGKSNVGHNHDDRYYTETEIDEKLNGKADSNHRHNDVSILKQVDNDWVDLPVWYMIKNGWCILQWEDPISYLKSNNIPIPTNSWFKLGNVPVPQTGRAVYQQLTTSNTNIRIQITSGGVLQSYMTGNNVWSYGTLVYPTKDTS